MVALRKESVDRNTNLCVQHGESATVALRKESVDRNWLFLPSWSLFRVALRKESVDRNCRYSARCVGLLCRSPQGERG